MIQLDVLNILQCFDLLIVSNAKEGRLGIKFPPQNHPLGDSEVCIVDVDWRMELKQGLL